MSLTILVSVEGDFLVLGDGGVVTLEGVVVVVTDPLGETVLDGGDEFVTGDEVDSVEGGTERLEGTKVTLVEGGEGDAEDEVIPSHRSSLVGVGHSDEPSPTLEGFLDGRDEDVGDCVVHRGGRCHGFRIHGSVVGFKEILKKVSYSPQVVRNEGVVDLV